MLQCLGRLPCVLHATVPNTESIASCKILDSMQDGVCCAGHSLVSEIIDFEQADDGMMVAYGVCDQLDELKHTYHGLPDFLTKVSYAFTSLHLFIHS